MFYQRCGTAVFLVLMWGCLQAGTMGQQCMAPEALIPCHEAAFDYAISALYFKPLYGDKLAYDAGLTYFDANDTTANVFHENQGKASFGLAAEGSYHFSNGDDIKFKWSFFGGTTHNIFRGNLFISPTISAPTLGSIIFNPKWSSINLEFGQALQLANSKFIRFYYGLSSANIRRRLDVYLFENNPLIPSLDDDAFAYVNNYQEFKGAGPRIGATLSYYCGERLKLYGGLATAFFFGRSKFDSDFFALDMTPLNPFEGIALTGKKYSFVPSLESKIGLSYTQPLALGSISFNLGFEVFHYFNPLFTAKLNTSLTPSILKSGFSLAGVNIGLRWIGIA